ncbi:MAG TPA: VOC family protein [Myxococcales bacterium]|jgi:catechol 2,3-dioxygenase-like lactoylglutathione lyase family enzyme|nr:VOC family protein [Myxococcales bacterium]
MDASDPTFGLPRLPIPVTALLMRLFFAWHRWAHRLAHAFAPRVHAIDHVTLPCRDLAAAERFYVDLLGARLMLRVDEAFLRRMGRPAEEAARGTHVSVVFDRGPRLDLFQYAQGQPPPLADHPHVALAVSPRALRRWQAKLEAAGVPTDGPRRLGPRGQASLYFNDPSGNHLELTALGFRGPLPVGAPTMSKLLPPATPGALHG